MPLPVNTLLVIGYLLGLYLLKKLIIKQLYALSTFLFRSSRIGLYFYAFLTFPGTLLHELSHLLTADLLGVPTGKLILVPTPTNHQKTKYNLGQVETARVGPVKGVLIGIAPFVVGIAFLFFLSSLYAKLSSYHAPWWQYALVFYAIFAVSQSMFISRSDLRFWPVLIIGLATASFFLYQTNLFSLLDNLLFPLKLTLYVQLALLLTLSLIRLVLTLANPKRLRL